MQTINRISEKEFYKRDIENFVNFRKHPCIVGSSVIEQGNYEFDIFEEFAHRESCEQMCENIYRFLENVKKKNAIQLYSYLAIFRNPGYISEIDFEEMLWEHLQMTHEYDSKKFGWDPSVGKNPSESDFSFSIGGQSFYIIGLHPMSSRKSRRFEHIGLVFNMHSQFENLRKKGVYSKIQKHVRQRELNMNGSINPMLADFGESSEAIQYSGRAVKEEWKCPFHLSEEIGDR